jgi:hypothetical protein
MNYTFSSCCDNPPPLLKKPVMVRVGGPPTTSLITPKHSPDAQNVTPAAPAITNTPTIKNNPAAIIRTVASGTMFSTARPR